MINLVVALHAEAKSLIAHYDLKSIKTQPFRAFEQGNLRLIISGVGKEKTTQAISYLHELNQNKSETAWLNIGIAGHINHAIGTGILANKIVDRESKKTWYPVRVFNFFGVSGSLLTVNSPSSSYDDSSIYDMESSAFFESAARYSTIELIHSYKIISDNSKSSHQAINADFVEKIVGSRLSEIDYLVSRLLKLTEELHSLEISNEELDPFFKQWHFTVTQKFQLKKLVRRLKTIAPSLNVFLEVQTLRNSDQVLAELLNIIHQTPVQL